MYGWDIFGNVTSDVFVVNDKTFVDFVDDKFAAFMVVAKAENFCSSLASFGRVHHNLLRPARKCSPFVSLQGVGDNLDMGDVLVSVDVNVGVVGVVCDVAVVDAGSFVNVDFVVGSGVGVNEFVFVVDGVYPFFELVGDVIG